MLLHAFIKGNSSNFLGLGVINLLIRNTYYLCLTWPFSWVFGVYYDYDLYSQFSCLQPNNPLSFQSNVLHNNTNPWCDLYLFTTNVIFLWSFSMSFGNRYFTYTCNLNLGLFLFKCSLLLFAIILYYPFNLFINMKFKV